MKRKLVRPFSAHFALTLILVSSFTAGPSTFAFTQSGVTTFIGSGVPMGHEWLTRRAAIEVLLATDPKHLDPADPVVPNDPNDPRRSWTNGLAKNLDLSKAQSEVDRIKGMPYTDSRFQSTYKLVFDPIIGERWVDIAGFNVTSSTLGSYNCFDAVAQEPVEIQYDHFMRQYNDSGGLGGVNAARQSQQRFMNYFIAAAMAPPTQILVWDGGGTSKKYTVDRNYFLLGRAAHLFEDSFSLEHVVRIPDDMYTSVRQVKSYLCAQGSEQHSHATPNTFGDDSGDVIWKPETNLGLGWKSYIPSNMKTNALVAMEATKDLWAAFIRTMAQPPGSVRQKQAELEAQTLVNYWLSVDANASGWYSNTANRDATYVLNPGGKPPGQTQEECMGGLGVGTNDQAKYVETLATNQKVCLYNLQPVPGYSDLYDTSVHMPFNWQWINYVKWSQPPAGWQIPDNPSDSGIRTYLISAPSPAPGYGITGVLKNNQIVKVSTGPSIGFIQVSTGDGTGGYYFRTAGDPTLFLSYTTTTGKAMLWNDTLQSSYTLSASATLKNYDTIMNQTWKQYLWVDRSGNVYVSSKGDPEESAAWWIIKPAAF
jgi:hypothetical protein